MGQKFTGLLEDESRECGCSRARGHEQAGALQGVRLKLREIASDVSLYSAEDAGRIIEVARCLDLAL
jgi:hypothetical protein